MTPRRLAMVLPRLSEGGGLDRSVYDVCRLLAARGHEVDLVVGGLPQGFPSPVPDEVNLIDLAAPTSAAMLRGLPRYLTERRPYAAHAVDFGASIPLLLARLRSRSSCRVTVGEHNQLSQALALLPPLRRLRALTAARALYRLADAFVAVSGGVADDLARTAWVSRDRVHVIFNPIGLDEIRRRGQAPVDHTWFGAGDDPVIVAAGRLSYQKDFGTLLRAFAASDARHGARLLILGEGEDRSALEALASQLELGDRCAMPGWIEDPAPFLARAAVVASSSRFEGLGRTLMEALALDRPIVATNCPSGPAEILQSGRLGTLVPVGDWNSLARAIDAALAQRHTWKGHPGDALDPFAPDAVADAYEAALLT